MKLGDAMGANDFDEAWAEGAALSTDEAIAYAQRGRGERKRPSSGWASLTTAERDVVRLVQDGLGNKEIAARLPPGISAVPRADIDIADHAHYPNRRPRPK